MDASHPYRRPAVLPRVARPRTDGARGLVLVGLVLYLATLVGTHTADLASLLPLLAAVLALVSATEPRG